MGCGATKPKESAKNVEDTPEDEDATVEAVAVVPDKGTPAPESDMVVEEFSGEIDCEELDVGNTTVKGVDDNTEAERVTPHPPKKNSDGVRDGTPIQGFDAEADDDDGCFVVSTMRVDGGGNAITSPTKQLIAEEVEELLHLAPAELGPGFAAHKDGMYKGGKNAYVLFYFFFYQNEVLSTPMKR